MAAVIGRPEPLALEGLAGRQPGPNVESGRNPGVPLDLGWVRGVRVNRSAAEHRADTLPRRRTVKGPWQVGWLLRAVTLLDLTTLSGDDTARRVTRLTAKARRPVRDDILSAIGMNGGREMAVRVAAVCVYPRFVETAVRGLEGSGIPVAAVAAGFPAGLSPWRERVADVRAAVKAGAAEVDIVITRAHVLTGDWTALYDEVSALREAAGAAYLKTILATGELGTLTAVARAALVAMMAGTDFVKTSTGKEAVNATIPVGLTMARAIRAYGEQTGHAVGLKPAGGIRTARDALSWLGLVKEELGDRHLRPDRLRLGASTVLADIERQLEYHVTGRYAAEWRQGIA